PSYVSTSCLLALPAMSAVYSPLDASALHSFPTRRSSDLGHRPELEHHELPAIEALSVLQKEHRPLSVELDQDRGQRDDRTQQDRSEEHTSELQSRFDLVCRLLLEKKRIYEHSNTDITSAQ